MFDKSYARRLQGWVNDLTPNRGDLRRLHNRFVLAAQQLNDEPISYEGLRLWKKGLLKQELELRSLRQLAAVRGETLQDVQVWLGQESSVGKSSGYHSGESNYQSLVELAESLPLEQLPKVMNEWIAAVQVGLNRIQRSYKEAKEIAVSSVSPHLEAAQFLTRVAKNNPVAFTKAGLSVNSERFKELLQGQMPTVPELLQLQDALRMKDLQELIDLYGFQSHSTDNTSTTRTKESEKLAK